jgi:soluble lytic murein transglycosylase-like protein
MRFLAATSVFALIFSVFGVAHAQETPVQFQYESSDIAVAEDALERQNEELERRIDEVTAVGSDLDESQALLNGANGRAAQLREEEAGLRRDLTRLETAHERARTDYEESVRRAYKNGGLKGVDLVLESLLGSGGEGAITDPDLARVLFGGRDALSEYRESARTVEDTVRQISEKNAAYNVAVADENARAEELRRREAALDAAVEELRAEREASAGRLQVLREEERARILATAPATGGAAGQRGYELRVARERIVAEEVEPIPYRRYVQLYRQSARQYGFAGDWHILAAVGKVESDHGQNMGPSSAGAMGPMQFLPSTWETSGVDGNGDGVANIMDPEDAIPAAARYLKTGGAPDDWYAALYSYNHADWYVRKVLAVAEGYRRLAGDETVGPYAVGE